ncbi:hypothetical protein EDC01DRAFT_780618 [Geopyxis carbonaria]|nr:hypothetical protein EDC01DRAFT_780618 [Geopyxis carbonaria]
MDRLRAVPRQTVMRYTTLAVRGLQFVFSTTISAIFISLVSSPTAPSTNLKPELGVLLAFTLLTAITSISTSILTLLALERMWFAALDVVGICGYVTTAVLLRGITTEYGCRQWLAAPHSESGNTAAPMRLAKRAQEERGECGQLRGVFGLSIIGCLLLLVSFQLLVYTLRARNSATAQTSRSRKGEEGRASVHSNISSRTSTDTEDRAFRK